MKLGIKTGLISDWISDLTKTQPDFTEIWFHSGKIGDYDRLMSDLQRLGIASGLHFWGILEGGIQANLAFPDKQILEASRSLVQKTIDTAAQNKSLYVNVHPGEAILTKVSFEKESFELLNQKSSFVDCREALLESLTELADYGKQRGIPLYVESVPNKAPGTPWSGRDGRLHPVDMRQIPLSIVETVLDIENLYFTNDFGHTAGNFVDATRSQIKDFIFTKTQTLVPKTKLLHVGYIIEPFNGTDYHGRLYSPEFATDAALPNKSEMKQLLHLFKSRDDVGVLVEPEADHVGNFFALKQLLEEV